MKKLILALLPLFILTAPAKADWSGANMNTTIKQTNFVVNGVCSGTLIDLKHRYVLTAKHCVDNQYETIEREKIDDNGIVTKERVRRLKEGDVRQIDHEGVDEIRQVVYRTKLVAVNGSRDLALLQIKADIPNTLAAKLACKEPARGDAVYIVGNPRMLYGAVVKGIVSSIQRSYKMLGFLDDTIASEDAGLMQISGGTIGGNSGGAVYNDSGELIGVPVLANTAQETLGFAVPLADIKAFLKDSKLEAIYAGCGAS